jgi:hypothetical protein
MRCCLPGARAVDSASVAIDLSRFSPCIEQVVQYLNNYDPWPHWARIVWVSYRRPRSILCSLAARSWLNLFKTNE